MKKYSLIIPTRNGGRYLINTVKSALANKYKNCEIIVSFNCSTDNSFKKIKKLKDKRLRIFNTPNFYSMSKHYEWILNKAQGDWISIIGDDDAVHKNFFETIDKYLIKYKNHKFEAISVDKANYYWNGVSNIYGKTVVRYLDLNHSKICNSNINLLKVIFGFMSYTKLPGLYVSGVINRKLINTIKRKEKNKFFHEINPDVYSALAISSFVKKYLRIEKPLFWVGTSKKSVAYKLILKKKKNFLIKYNNFIKKSEKDKIFISSKINKYFWHSRLPSAFIFSALFNIPNNKYKNSKIYNFMFLCTLGSDILNKSYLKNKKERTLIKQLYLDTVKKSKIPYHLIYFFTILLFSLKKLHKKIANFFAKVKYFLYKKIMPERYVYSSDRRKFKNIYIASQLN